MSQPGRSPGAILAGRFVLERVLGSGAFGEVWLAHDAKAFHRRVAVKFLRPEHLHNPEVVARFHREGEATAALMHPNVVTLIEFGTDGEIPYLVSEFIDGRSLRDILNERNFRQQFVTPEEALGVFRQICAAVRAAHVKGIIHRDLKPDNVLLQGGDLGANVHAKVVDFGIARIVHPTPNRAPIGMATNAGQVIGSPQYMAPEQVLGDVKSIGIPTDIFALGAVLFELLALQFAFPGKSYFEVIQRILEAPRPTLTPLRPELSPELDLVLAKCFALHPNERFASVDELLKSVERVLTERPTQPGPQHPAPEAPAPNESDQTRIVAAKVLSSTAGLAPSSPTAPAESTRVSSLQANGTHKTKRLQVRDGVAIPAAPNEQWHLGEQPEDGAPSEGRSRSTPSGGGSLGWVLLALCVLGAGAVFAVPGVRHRVFNTEAPSDVSPSDDATANPNSNANQVPPPRWIFLGAPAQSFKLGRATSHEGHVGFAVNSNVVFSGPAFRMMHREVTWAEFETWAHAKHIALGGIPSWVPSSPSERALWPVVGVAWEDAHAYCIDLGGELPTEAQWEFAARGMVRRLNPWGSGPSPGTVAAYRGTDGRTDPVEKNSADLTPEGLHDLAGNAQEWTNSRFVTDDGHEPGPQNTARTVRGLPLREPGLPTWPEAGLYRMAGCVGPQCSAGERSMLEGVGFRCVRPAGSHP